MAEVVSALIGSIASVLAQEVLFFTRVRIDLNEIKDELESMVAFLKDADRRKESSEEFRTWKYQVRDAAYDAEDIIDEFIYQTRRKRRSLTGFFNNSILLPKNLIRRHQFGMRVQAIREKVRAISERKKRYSLDRIEEGSSSTDHGERWAQPYGEFSLFEEEDDVVGIEKGRDLLVRWLIDENQQWRTIISVVGMGGVGKTTLVSKAYMSQVVRKNFDCFAWLSVSQSYRIVELLKYIVKEVYRKMTVKVPNDLAAMNDTELVERLRSFLQQKRYVIVLDDIWNLNVWNDLNAAFPDCRCGSRIIVTTRKMDIASSLGSRSIVYHLQPLDDESAWTLFCRKAFWNEPSNSCPDELLPLAKTLVGKCNGLPLAVVALGGLLSSRNKTVSEWKKLEDSLSWELSNNQSLERVKSILLLSFNDLPHYLRCCFLYCSAYPEDYLIRRKRLIRQWISEGFIEESKGLVMEEVADLYLRELVSRSMLQVKETDPGIFAILVHDLLRELALQVAEKEKIFLVYDGRNTNFNVKARRLAIHRSDRNEEWGMLGLPLRSFLLFVKDTNSVVLPRFKFLRTLDLEGSPIRTLPNGLVNLFNLRYFSLKSTQVSELPKSFGKLQNLQTLDVRYTNVRRLPSDIRKLKILRHLLACSITSLMNPDVFANFSAVRAPKGICNLGSTLQSLDCIEADGNWIEEISNLTQLRKFAIEKVQAADGTKLCMAIQKMNHLRRLLVMTTKEEETLRLESLSSPPPFLHRLTLVGHLEKLPCWVGSLRSMTRLTLICCGLTEDPVSSLSSLHAFSNLVRLVLRKAFVGERLYFHRGGFPRLRGLRLIQCMQLNQVVVEEGAMPQLEELYLNTCPELKMPPIGIQYLTCLQEIRFREMPEELIHGLHEYYDQHQMEPSRIPKFMRIYLSETGLSFERVY